MWIVIIKLWIIFFSLNWILFHMHINAFMPYEMVTFEAVLIIKEKDTQL
jgi:hypothetical protein